MEQEKSHADIEKAIELGVNFIDLADAYAKGQAERKVGDYLREENITRKHLVISSELPHAKVMKLPASSTGLDLPCGVTEVSMSTGVNSLRSAGTTTLSAARYINPTPFILPLKRAGFLS